jgi:hypothetical protein
MLYHTALLYTVAQLYAYRHPQGGPGSGSTRELAAAVAHRATENFLARLLQQWSVLLL